MHRSLHRNSIFCLMIFTLLGTGFSFSGVESGFSSDSLMPFGADPKESFQTNISFDKTTATYLFEYQGEQNITYLIPLNDPQTQKGLIKIGVQMDGSNIAYPVSGGGTRYRNKNGDILEPSDFANVALVQLTTHALENDKLSLNYKETYEGVTHFKIIEYSLQGKTLVFHITSDDTNGKDNYFGFSFGQSEQMPQAHFINIPYAIEPIVVFDDRWFSSVYLDRTKSNAVQFRLRTWLVSADSVVAYHDTSSAEDTQGHIAPLNETGYITVSAEVMDVLPRINNPPSPYRADLSNKVVLDLWEVDPADFNIQDKQAIWQASQKLLESFHEFGLEDLAVIYHQWQCYGYDIKLPDHFPANPFFGSQPEFQKMITTAKSYGYLFALHENYADMTVDSPSYNTADLVQLSDGSFQINGNHPITGAESRMLAGDKAILYAEKEGQQIKQTYDPNAAYLDVNTAWSPTDYLDLSAENPNEKTTAAAVRVMKTLFLHQKNLYQGPLFGEGGVGRERFDTYYAGYVDGVERTIDNNYLGLIIPDFELQAVKPLMVNQGMGYYGRYFIPPETAQQWLSPGEADWDLYRASEIAYGHAGFISNATLSSSRFPMLQMRWVLTEYYMLQQLQEQYLAGNVTAVQYESRGQLVPLNQALIDRVDFLNPHLGLLYDNGLNLLMNFERGTRNFTSSTDYGFQQGYNGWHYQYWNASGYKDMNSGTYSWQGDEESCFLWSGSAAPGPSCEPALSWVSPITVEATITGQVYDLDPNCGDGVMVAIYKNADEVWSNTLQNGDTTGIGFDLKVPLEKNDQLYFRVNALGNADCDTTHLDPTIAYTLADTTWEVSANGEKYVLPSSGWVAWNPSLNFVEYSALVDGQRVDYAETPRYIFARGRIGKPQAIGRITTDGAVALVNASVPERQDVHMVTASQVQYDGRTILTTSAVCDLNLLHVDENHIRISVGKIIAADTVNLTLMNIPSTWLTADGQLPKDSSIQVWQTDSAGQHEGNPLEWSVNDNGTALVLNNLAANQWYEVNYEAGRQPPAAATPTTPELTVLASPNQIIVAVIVGLGILISLAVLFIWKRGSKTE